MISGPHDDEAGDDPRVIVARGLFYRYEGNWARVRGFRSQVCGVSEQTQSENATA